MKERRIKRFNKNSELNISDVMFSFSDMIGFTRWILQGDDMGIITRYIYIESKDDFIDDDGNRYTWEELYSIYQKNCLGAVSGSCFCGKPAIVYAFNTYFCQHHNDELAKSFEARMKMPDNDFDGGGGA
jgi:hypothetical protein